jgi:murein DD-endopeptidase MepM/ murein hydrolase activator NlpD
MALYHKIKKELNRHLTVMLIPHNTVKPLRLSFSLSFVLFLISLWTGVTLWAGYLSSRHIDYWRIESEHNLMKIKVMFFAKEVKKSREMLEHVRENDENIRTLLQLKSKKAIIETEGRGGPAPEEAGDLNRLLAGKIHEMSNEDIYRQTHALIQETQNQIQSYKEITGFVDNQRALYMAIPNCMPCVGNITSKFGYRIHPIYQVSELHTGLDIANALNTPVYSTAFGTVIFCEWQPGYGRLIIVDNGYGYKTLYGHLNKFVIKAGDKIKRGQLIGLMGNTGSSTGIHTHYEIRCKDAPIDPANFIKKDLFSVADTKGPLSIR